MHQHTNTTAQLERNPNGLSPTSDTQPPPPPSPLQVHAGSCRCCFRCPPTRLYTGRSCSTPAAAAGAGAAAAGDSVRLGGAGGALHVRQLHTPRRIQGVLPVPRGRPPLQGCQLRVQAACRAPGGREAGVRRGEHGRGWRVALACGRARGRAPHHPCTVGAAGALATFDRARCHPSPGAASLHFSHTHPRTHTHATHPHSLSRTHTHRPPPA